MNLLAVVILVAYLMAVWVLWMIAIHLTVKGVTDWWQKRRAKRGQ